MPRIVFTSLSCRVCGKPTAANGDCATFHPVWVRRISEKRDPNRPLSAIKVYQSR